MAVVCGWGFRAQGARFRVQGAVLGCSTQGSSLSTQHSALMMNADERIRRRGARRAGEAADRSDTDADGGGQGGARV
eukprot:1968436-Rhodomonas_salina.1